MSSRTRSLLALALALAGSAGASKAESLSEAVRAAPTGSWLAYRVPLNADVGRVCCVDWRNPQATSRCRLTDSDWNLRRDAVRRAPEARLVVYLEIKSQAVEAVRAFDTSCAVDEGAARVRALDHVQSEHSIGLLETLARGRSEHSRSTALAVLALHADAAATAALTRLAARDQASSLRRDALFWLGSARGEAGFDVVAEVIAHERAPELRHHAVFALSQSASPRRAATLAALARSPQDDALRGEALFWMAGQNLPEVESAIATVLAGEPSPSLSEKAILALAQLPRERATPALLALLADPRRPREQRQQALFWLAQSDDDAALRAIDGLLGASR
jgi:HEAT repeat protein